MIKQFNSRTWLTLLMSLVLASNVSAFGDSFSCSYGKRGACLDYGDKVCSSYAKCVSSDAVCFDSFTCNFKGFICKSKFNELADEYDSLLIKCKNIASEHDELVDEYDNLLRKYKNAISEYEDLQSCISGASSLEEAQSCY